MWIRLKNKNEDIVNIHPNICINIWKVNNEIKFMYIDSSDNEKIIAAYDSREERDKDFERIWEALIQRPIPDKVTGRFEEL